MYLFNNETITLDHTIFDVTILHSPHTDEEIKEAKLKKAQYLIEQGQITLAETPATQATTEVTEETPPTETKKSK